MINENKADSLHYDLHPTSIAKDEEAVSSIVSLTECWVNPFANQQGIISISMTKVATPEVTSDLLNALEI